MPSYGFLGNRIQSQQVLNSKVKRLEQISGVSERDM